MDPSLANIDAAVYIETYGCQMNKYDSEIVAGILTKSGCRITDDTRKASVILINTCSVRAHAEIRALGRLNTFAGWKSVCPERKLGIIGCTAQRLGRDLLEKKPFLDFVIGPDEYQRLPELIANGHSDSSAHVQLSTEETYAEVQPLRRPGITGWISVMRGCNNFCSYCIVPYTRGRERSRPAGSIIAEIESMVRAGFVEVTLLGQNVNSYFDGSVHFAELLDKASRIEGMLRIRFMTSHPKDLTEHILDIMASRDAICPHLHLPVQSGSNRILSLMNRDYTRDRYLRCIESARDKIPGIAITSDIMVGFPGETESDFNDTLNLVKNVEFDDAYTYRYSPREGTKAARMEGLVGEQERLDRLDTLIRVQRTITLEKKRALIGSRVNVLPESTSKKSPHEWMGKTPGNQVVVFPKAGADLGNPVDILIEECRGTTLRGKIADSA